MDSERIKPKLFSVIKRYNANKFVKDVIAGIIVAIIALPLSIALAIASGVSPEKGIHTAIIAGFMISFFGGSRVQIGGPTAAFVVIVVGIIGEFGIDGLIVATIMAGIFLVIMGLCRMGSLIKYIPSTITVGFTAGIAMTLFVQQLKDLLGLQIDNVPSEFFERISCYVENIGTFNPYAFGIGVLALIIMIVMPYITEKIPGSLVAIIVTTLVVKFAGLEQVSTIGSVYGELSSAFPTPSIPNVSFEMIRKLISPAFTIAILAAIESLLSCVVSDGMIGSRHRSNMELVAQGIGNICSGLFGGIPATGAIARTAANVKNGGRTPIAGMVHAIVLAVIMLVLMPYAALIPMTTLSAVLIIVAYNMCGWREFVAMRKAPKSDFVVLVLTFVLTVCFDLVVAIEIGMVLVALLFMSRMANVTAVRKWVDSDDFDEDNDSDSISLMKLPKKTVVYEISGPMFFGAVDKFMDILAESKKPNYVMILRMRSVPALDATAYKTLENIYNQCKASGMQLILSHVNEQPMEVLKKEGLYYEIGGDKFMPHIREAIKLAEILIAERKAK